MEEGRALTFAFAGRSSCQKLELPEEKADVRGGTHALREVVCHMDYEAAVQSLPIHRKVYIVQPEPSDWGVYLEKYIPVLGQLQLSYGACWILVNVWIIVGEPGTVFWKIPQFPGLWAWMKLEFE